MWVNDLQSGVPANQTLCPQHWVWYRIQTRVPAAATLANTGAVVLGDGGDVLTFEGGLNTMATSGTTLAGTLRTDLTGGACDAA